MDSFGRYRLLDKFCRQDVELPFCSMSKFRMNLMKSSVTSLIYPI